MPTDQWIAEGWARSLTGWHLLTWYNWCFTQAYPGRKFQHLKKLTSVDTVQMENMAMWATFQDVASNPSGMTRECCRKLNRQRNLASPLWLRAPSHQRIFQLSFRCLVASETVACYNMREGTCIAFATFLPWLHVAAMLYQLLKCWQHSFLFSTFVLAIGMDEDEDWWGYRINAKYTV